MKKYIIILTLLLFPVLAGAATISQQRLNTVVNSFRGDDGFECIKIGRAGISFIRAAARLSADDDDAEEIRQVMKVLKGIKKIYVIEYEGMSPARKQQFGAKVSDILRNESLLMEAKDGDERMAIYGTVNADNSVENLIVHAADEALICLFGTFSVEEAMTFMQMNE